jgi:type II secretory pathway component PulF
MNIISPVDLAFFNRQLASMVRLQTPLAEGFQVLSRECSGKHFQQILEEIHQKLASGKKLSEALAERSDIFPPTYIALIEAGETSGDLAGALENMADYSETTTELRSIFFNVSIIPIMTSCVIVLILGFLTVFVLPKFKEIFVSLGVDLPPITLMLLTIGSFFNEAASYGGWVVLLGIVVLLLICFIQRPVWFDWILLNLPFVGLLLRSVYYTRFCMTVSHLLRQRIPLPQALGLARGVVPSPIMQGAIEDMQHAVESGQSLAEQARASGVFPETMSWKLSFAEKKGNLVEAFHELHRYFLQYFRMLAPRFMYIIAPCVVLIMGLIVAFVLLSVFLPIFKLQTMLVGG